MNMVHERREEADEILGGIFHVAEGTVSLMDYMGGDERVLEAGRRHYGNKVPEDRTQAMNFLARGNRDIMGMIEFRFCYTMPIFGADSFVHELRRASHNEYSLRYSFAEESAATLSDERIRLDLPDADQDLVEKLIEENQKLNRLLRGSYDAAIEDGIAKELARLSLGSNQYTRFYMKINLADLLDFAETTLLSKSIRDETGLYLCAIMKLASLVAPQAVGAGLRERSLEFLLDFEFGRSWSEYGPGQHDISEDAEKLVDKPITILNGGYVTLVDYMGNDLTAVMSARVSTGGDRPRRPQEDRALLNYLLRNRHTTPFEMTEFLWEIVIPKFVYRQIGRHRTFERVVFEFNDLKFYEPKSEDIALQSTQSHQGRGEVAAPEVASRFLENLRRGSEMATEHYRNLANAGLPEEVRKRNLPVGNFIKLYFKGDLHNTLHLLGLRMHEHAQKETRDFAQAIARTVEAVAPWSYDSFRRYNLNAVRFSEGEQKLLKRILQGESLDVTLQSGVDLSKREIGEFREKIERLIGKEND